MMQPRPTSGCACRTHYSSYSYCSRRPSSWWSCAGWCACRRSWATWSSASRSGRMRSRWCRSTRRRATSASSASCSSCSRSASSSACRSCARCGARCSGSASRRSPSPRSAAMVALHFVGYGWQAGLVLGGALAMSSTAIVSKMLAERMELGTPHGRDIMGILLFQDLAVVAFLIVIPSLGQVGRRARGGARDRRRSRPRSRWPSSCSSASDRCAPGSTWSRASAPPSSSCSTCCW